MKIFVFKIRHGFEDRYYEKVQCFLKLRPFFGYIFFEMLSCYLKIFTTILVLENFWVFNIKI